MIKLRTPSVSYDQVLDICLEGITGNNLLKQKLHVAKQELVDMSNDYQAKAKAGTLYQINKFFNKDEIIAGELKKTDLDKLYPQYFRNEDKPARSIYDGLLAANDRCPYCSGIGVSKNLDHYLAKKLYPQFSVLPANLVPACRDCNMGEKGDASAQHAEEQVIQPYLEDDCFFNEQWLYARYLSSSNDGVDQIEYYVDPPSDWSEVNKARVQAHFKQFGLALRFAEEAGIRAAIYIKQIEEMISRSITKQDAKEIVLDSVIKSFKNINHWERVLCCALFKSL